MHVIKKESPKRLKYDMFKRLNTGGLLLSAQEIRNSTIRLLGEKFIDFISSLKSDKNFESTLSYVSDENHNEQFDDELILRFFTLKNAPIKMYEGTLADFMTKYAELVTDGHVNFDYSEEESIFLKTFAILNAIMPNGKIFSGTTTAKQRQGQFLGFHFEAFSLAIVLFLDKISTNDERQISRLREGFEKLKSTPRFQEVTKNEKEKRTSGSKYMHFLDIRISLVMETIKKSL